MKDNKGQAVVEMAILSVLIVVMLTVALQITKYLEAVQKTQTAAFFAAQAWSIERPRYTGGNELWAETQPTRDSIEARVLNFLQDKDLIHDASAGGNFSVDFGTSSISPRVEVENTVKINFPWYEALSTELILPIKAKVETQPYPFFHDYKRGWDAD